MVLAAFISKLFRWYLQSLPVKLDLKPTLSSYQPWTKLGVLTPNRQTFEFKPPPVSHSSHTHQREVRLLLHSLKWQEASQAVGLSRATAGQPGTALRRAPESPSGPGVLQTGWSSKPMKQRQLLFHTNPDREL